MLFWHVTYKQNNKSKQNNTWQTLSFASATNQQKMIKIIFQHSTKHMQNIMPMCPLSFCNNSSMSAARFATWTSVYGKLKQSCNKFVAQRCGVSPCGVESQLDDLCILFQVPDKADGTTVSPGRFPSLGLTLTAALAVAPGFRPCRGVQSSSPPSRSSHSSPC